MRDYVKLGFIGHNVEPYAEEIALHCKMAFVSQNIDPAGNVIACIVMTLRTSYAVMVSVSMGKNFIREDNLRGDGKRVMDCHAEILARRGLIRYLLLQIQAAQLGQKSIVKEASGGCYAIDASEVKFHLYVSKAPCGCAALPVGCRNSAHLRYRKDGGEGNLLLVQPGCFYKMSCSDKITLWNVVGMQGALLSQILTEPVFFSSIIMENTSQGSAEVAFTGRLHGLQIEHHSPIVVVINSGCAPFVTKKKKPDHRAICWVCSDEEGEVLDTSTGLKSIPGGQHSTDISKAGIFQLWSDIMDGIHFPTYGECKLLAVDYQRKKEAFHSYCEMNSMGEWFHEPPLIDNFSLPSSESTSDTLHLFIEHVHSIM